MFKVCELIPLIQLNQTAVFTPGDRRLRDDSRSKSFSAQTYGIKDDSLPLARTSS
jgi:hypothetical protein